MDNTTDILDVDATTFATEVIEASHQRPVVVDFWAAWCGPCKSLMPLLERLADEYQGAFRLAKVNTDEHSELASQWGVRSLPTVKVFRHGVVVEEFMGAQPESAIRPLIDGHLVRPSDAIVEQAVAARDAGDIDQALALLQPLLEDEPDNTRLQLQGIHLLTEVGALDEASRRLGHLPVNWQGEPEVEELQALVALGHIAAEAGDVSTADLQDRATADADDLTSWYRLGARQAMAGDHEAAMASFLHIIGRDRTFADDGGRRALLHVFTLQGNSGELVNRYRSRLFALLH